MGDVVQGNGTVLASTFVNATTLTAIIPANLLTAGGTAKATLSDAFGRTSAALPFVVNADPAIPQKLIGTSSLASAH